MTLASHHPLFLDPVLEAEHSLHYQHILREIGEGSLALARRLGAEVDLPEGAGQRSLTLSEIVRAHMYLAYVVRRSIVVSRYIEQEFPNLAQAGEGAAERVMAAFEHAIAQMKTNAIDAPTYYAAMEAELDSDKEELHEDIPGRSSPGLIVELCRDLGMALQLLPLHWRTLLPISIRPLVARSTAAAISPPAARIGHAMER